MWNVKKVIIKRTYQAKYFCGILSRTVKKDQISLQCLQPSIYEYVLIYINALNNSTISFSFNNQNQEGQTWRDWNGMPVCYPFIHSSVPTHSFSLSKDWCIVMDAKRSKCSLLCCVGPEPNNTPLHNATAPPGEASHAQSRPPPPNGPGLQHRSLPPQRSSPLGT